MAATKKKEKKNIVILGGGGIDFVLCMPHYGAGICHYSLYMCIIRIHIIGSVHSSSFFSLLIFLDFLFL